MEVNISSLNNEEIMTHINYLKIVGFVALSLLIAQAQSAPKAAASRPAAAHPAVAPKAAPAPKTAPAHDTEDIKIREKEAFELFMHLLECPVDQVPTWKEFVD